MAEVRALLLTDVVDSTRLSAALGDKAMAEAWAAHDRVARDLLPRWRGREIDKTDGMLLLFDTAADAVSYALHYHEALAGLAVPLVARAGLHVGPVILRKNNEADVTRGAKPLEVEGLAKPTAARVMSLARGAQTLLTAEARAELGDTSLKVQSHGHWMIKGVSDPIELFEVGQPDAQFTMPVDGEKVYRVVRIGDWWLPVKEIPNNLSQPSTSFIGRERELDEVKAMLDEARLVTLLGMGGLGKTRLSLQVAAEQMHLFPEGVWFFDLAPLTDPVLVVAEAARTLGVSEEPGRPLLQTICAHLNSRRVLVILDNCEHLIRPAAEFAHAVITSCPLVRLLASSREALHVPGEHTYPILPLPMPDRADGLEALARSTAVRLFVERAQAHKPAFELNEHEAPAIVELVARLEGIPLALELAAARVRSLSVADINTRLKDRYKLLTGGSRVLQQRQQTLRAAVDWSYELLSAEEQTLLCRLAVFAGGFDLDSAEQVCGDEPLSSDDVMDLLASLVEKSLAMLEEREGAARYRMLETIRDYAREKLDRGADGPATSARHCEHFFRVAKTVGRGLQGPDQAASLRRMETELDNVRGAMALALAGGMDPKIAVSFATAMQGFWILRSYATEGRRIVKAALALPACASSPFATGHALYVAAALAESQSDHPEAQQMLETCLRLRRELGEPVDIAATLSTLALARLQSGDVARAEADEREALEIFRQLGDRVGEAIGLLHLGQIAMYRADHAQARSYLQRGLVIARALKHQETEGEFELLLGEVAMEAGDSMAAPAHFARSLAVCREAADRRGEANALWRLAKVDLQAGDAEAARARLAVVLREFRAAGMHRELLGCLEDHAILAHLEGATVLAVHVAATATAERQRFRLARPPIAEQHWQAHLRTLREGLPHDEFASAWSVGLNDWQVEDAIRSAVAPL